MKNIEEKIYNYCKSFSDDATLATALIMDLIKDYSQHDNTQHQVIPKDAILITYGDQISQATLTPLQAQRKWLNDNMKKAIKAVHILPFYPYTSDDGFSVQDYKSVHKDMGSWQDIESFASDYNLMFDTVVNHCSKSHKWFVDFLAGKEYCQDYFIEVDTSDNRLDLVVRPRSLPLTHSYESSDGIKNIWTTFSEDQIDLNFNSPHLLVEIISILLFYAQKGAKYIRLDAITFAIKKLGTSCATLPETHDLVKLIRLIFKHVAPSVTIITETNVPHAENISYFGNGDEAQMVYNFPLPPLIIHSVLSEDVTIMAKWMQGLDKAPANCSYFNISATHDGIGVRGASKELGFDNINKLAEACLQRGGQILTRKGEDGNNVPYELNITFFDMLNDVHERGSNKAVDKFMLSQYLVLAFKGVPGVYFHNLFGTTSWQEGYEQTKMGRTLNRRKFSYEEITNEILSNPIHRAIFDKQKQALELYNKISCFGPNPKQEIIKLNKSVLMIKRNYEVQELLAVFNFSDNQQEINIDGSYVDLLSNNSFANNMALPAWSSMWLTKKTNKGEI